MAPNPTKRSGAKRAALKKRFSLSRNLKKGLVVLTILSLIAAVAGLTAYWMVAPPPPRPAKPVAAIPVPPIPPVQVPVPAATAPASPPAYEVFPPDDKPPAKISPFKVPPATRPPLPTTGSPRVTIIIDDIGFSRPAAERFIDLGAPLTLAVLPFSPHGRRMAERAREKGLDVMLHLPMEPDEYPAIDPGPGALLTRMSPDQIIAQVRVNLDQLDAVKGINNHMGSRFTADADKMNQVFSVLKQQDLFFIDSRTTAATVAHQAARLLQVPYAQRDVFLDNVQTHEAVRRQMALLVETAKHRGEAIGIGHPYPVTYEVLREMLPELKQTVTLVTASEAVRILH
jgi:hypothetical protein